MVYQSVREGVFIERPNRFIARVFLQGHEEICHVKNTGRCRELLLPGARVFLEESRNPNRRTKYDLIAVYKGERLINMDSAAPNRAVAEFLPNLFPEASLIRPETRFKDSRFDFYVEAGERKIWVEVKGVTLEEDGAVFFPDAPTQRGVKHLQELTASLREGYEACILFVIQMADVHSFAPTDTTHPAFGQALRVAAAAGVQVAAYACHVEPGEMRIEKRVPFYL